MEKEDFNKYREQIIRLRALLSIVTICWLLVFVNEITELIALDYITYLISWYLISILVYLTAFIFIWFIWTKYPGKRKQKINFTLSILILNIIGMWVWLPNKRELNKLKTIHNKT